jgi:hypothetical protein
MKARTPTLASVNNPDPRGSQPGSRFTFAAHLRLQAEKFKLSGDNTFEHQFSLRLRLI